MSESQLWSVSSTSIGLKTRGAEVKGTLRLKVTTRGKGFEVRKVTIRRKGREAEKQLERRGSEAGKHERASERVDLARRGVKTR